MLIFVAFSTEKQLKQIHTEARERLFNLLSERIQIFKVPTKLRLCVCACHEAARLTNLLIINFHVTL
jgi:hypothetical protein